MHQPFILKVKQNDPILQELIEKGVVHKFEPESIDKEELDEIMKNYTPPKLQEPKFAISLESNYLLDPKGNKVDFQNLFKNN